jgi:outer membrane receptor protein involved in Fe transport
MVNRQPSLLLGTAIGLVALGTPAAAQEGRSPAAAVQDEHSGSEIVVTAQRREQLLAEVPQSISVVGGETLEKQQARSFLDYAQLVPGLSVTQENPGETRVILRGVNTGSVGSTVAVYLDDVPFGASGSLSNGGILAGDFDTFDVARVEVLRGPQGTLYGSNSLGGVVKYVTAAPRTDRFEARAQAGIEDVKGGDTGYFANAVVNVPLGDTLAFRASGFYRDLGGYVDTVGRSGDNVNSSESYGGRASLLFTPVDNLSVRLFALYQQIGTNSPSSFAADPATLKPVNPITGARQGDLRTRYERIPERNKLTYQLYSGTIDYDFGGASLVSITSYAKQERDELGDVSTNALRGTANAVLAPTAPGTVGLAQENDVYVDKFTQEVRLQSADSDTFEWVVGGYYTKESTLLDQIFVPFTLATQAVIPVTGTFITAQIEADYEEFAGFASGTLTLGQFELTAGGRYSRNNQSSSQAVNILAPGTPTLGKSDEGVFTWAVAPRFEINERVSLYGRVAKGYRPGGPNFIPPNAGPDYPAEFNADTIVSYELGLRAETPDRSFAFDGSVFYLDWDDILIATTTTVNGTPVGINGNGRRARSKGAEITATLRPTPGFTVVSTLAYTDAELRDDTTPTGGGLNLTGGLAGDQLPYAPEITANLAADYEFDIGANATAYVGGNVHLIGDQAAGFSAAYRATFGRRVEIDGYQTVDLRAGVEFGKFTVQAYVRNLTDEYGVVSAGGYPFTVPVAIGGQGRPLLTVSTIRPRTIGAMVGFAF